MTKEELIILLSNEIFSEKGKLKYSALNRLDDETVNVINSYTDFIQTDDIKERVYYILNNLTTEVKCSECTTVRPTFISIKSGYYDTCSKKCSTIKSASKAYTTKIAYNSFEQSNISNKKTKLEKYGNENYNNRAKSKETCLERYGVEHHNQHSELLDKIKATCLERYGVDNPFKAEEFKDKIKATCLERYGFENVSQTGLFENSGYKWKEFEYPSGNIIKIQGYEHFLLNELLETYDESEIITRRKDMPEFWYVLDGIKRRYFPDAYIEKTKTIYEVKSLYTLNNQSERNNLKFESVKNSGFNFELKIYNPDGTSIL